MKSAEERVSAWLGKRSWDDMRRMLEEHEADVRADERAKVLAQIEAHRSAPVLHCPECGDSEDDQHRLMIDCRATGKQWESDIRTEVIVEREADR